MKITKEVINNKEFKPIKINIDIESLEELKTLWLRFNLSSIDVLRCNKKYFDINYLVATNNLWNILNEELIKYVDFN